jgi:hypothetical protein
MSSVDGDAHEPFKLDIQSIQGRWMCEELSAALTVTGNMVQYSSGECYPIEVNPEGKLEIFGYRGLEKKSDASSVIWKNKETGHILTWMYEGDKDDVEPEVDANLIIQGEGRSSRKRKVDYVALDRKLALEEAGKQGEWKTQYDEMRSRPSSSGGSNERDIEFAFLRLKKKFNDWMTSMDSSRCKLILEKRGYLSTEIEFDKSSVESEAAGRLMAFIKSTGAKAMQSQIGNKLIVRVPEQVWKSLCAQSSSDASASDKEIMAKVESIKKQVISYCDNESRTDSDSEEVVRLLQDLEQLPVDLEVLKATKIGVEINRLSKFLDRAKETLAFLKNIYLDSKKNS